MSIPPRAERSPRNPAADGDPPRSHAPRDDAITELLDAAGRGERDAAAELLPLVYDELRSLAGARMARIPPGQTLQPTALVHEVWVRLSDRRPEGWAGRAEFFHAAARSMRDLLVEDARRKSTQKRGGDRRRLVLQDDDSGLAVGAPDDDVLALDEALRTLEVEHPEPARIVGLRYFAGLTVEEVAQVTGTSVSTVERQWRLARAWLKRSLASDPGPDSGPDSGRGAGPGPCTGRDA